MTDLAHRRTEAWAGLLTEPRAFPSRARRDALLLARQNAGVAQRARSARTACSGARASLANLRRSAALGQASGLTREWLECLDDLLAAADRICVLAAERDTSAPS